MPKATFPATLGELMFDAVIERKRNYNATIPEYPTEQGFKFSDAVLKSTMTMNLTVFVSNTPVQWRSALKGAKFETKTSNFKNRLEETVKVLEEMYYSGDVYTFTACGKTWKNMAIESISVPEVTEMLNAAEIEITLKQVVITKSQIKSLEDISESYERSSSQANNTYIITSATNDTSAVVKEMIDLYLPNLPEEQKLILAMKYNEMIESKNLDYVYNNVFSKGESYYTIISAICEKFNWQLKVDVFTNILLNATKTTSDLQFSASAKSCFETICNFVKTQTGTTLKITIDESNNTVKAVGGNQ